MTGIFIILTLLLPLLQQPSQQMQTAFRVRLFAAAQPAEITLTRQGAQPERIRASGTRITVDGRAVTAPHRIGVPATLSAEGVEAVRVSYPLEISARDGRLTIIASVPREEYVAAVLAGEAAVFRSDESLKAMAVAARTYAAHFPGRHAAEGFDFCDTTHCQDFRAVAVNTRMRRAAEATAGEVIRYEGEPIAAYYHQDCGGITEAQSPYLPQIDDVYCIAQGRMQWSAEITAAQLQAALQLPSIENIQTAGRTPSGRVAQIRVSGERPRMFEAEAFRLAVGRTLGWNRLRSDLYSVRRSAAGFVFQGFGAGHGIGLCQHGAAAMGDLGKSYRQILAYYYPNTQVAAPSGIQWIRSASAQASLETTRAQDARLLDVVGRLMRSLEEAAGRRFEATPVVRFYPTVAAFRDATGEPGWMAGSTRSNIIRLQPADTLTARGVLESTLQHELGHVLVESRATATLPRWFREGVVLWLTQPRMAGNIPAAPALSALERAIAEPQSESQLRESYKSAQEAVELLVRQQGKAVVLGWAEKGLPANLEALFRSRTP